MRQDEVPLGALYSAAMTQRVDENKLFDLLYEENVETRRTRYGKIDDHMGEDFETAYTERFDVDTDEQEIRVDGDEFDLLTESWAHELEGEYVRDDRFDWTHGPKRNWLFPKRIGYGTAQPSTDLDELSVDRNHAAESATAVLALLGGVKAITLKAGIQSVALDKALLAGGALATTHSRVSKGRAERYRHEITDHALAEIADEFADYTVCGVARNDEDQTEIDDFIDPWTTSRTEQF